MIAHAVAQRLHLGQDVAREQHGPPLARAPPRCSRWKTASISGSRPAVGSSSSEQLGVGGERRDQRDLLAVALGVRAALLASGRARSARAAPSRRFGSSPPRSRPSRSIASPPVRFGHSVHVTGDVGEPAVQRDGVAPRVAAEQPRRRRRRRAAGRAGRGSWSTCRRRWGRGTRGPRRSRPRGRARRARGWSPNVLTRPEISIAGLLMIQRVHMIHEVVNGGKREPTSRPRHIRRAFALLLDEAGMPRMPARVFAAILAEDAGRLTARELAEPARRSAPPRSPAPSATSSRSADARCAGATPAPAATTTGSRRRRLVRGLRPPRAAARAVGAGRRATAPRRSAPDTPAGARLQETREFFAFLRRSCRR